MDAGRAAERPSPLLSALRRWVDPVVARAGFAWNESGCNRRADDGRLTSALYEADPTAFVRRYPESDLEESYGDGWPPPCVDLWLTFDWDTKRADLDVEGFDVVEDLRSSGQAAIAARATRLSDDADEDARTIATALAIVLRIPGPESSPAARDHDG